MAQLALIRFLFAPHPFNYLTFKQAIGAVVTDLIIDFAMGNQFYTTTNLHAWVGELPEISRKLRLLLKVIPLAFEFGREKNKKRVNHMIYWYAIVALHTLSCRLHILLLEQRGKHQFFRLTKQFILNKKPKKAFFVVFLLFCGLCAPG